MSNRLHRNAAVQFSIIKKDGERFGLYAQLKNFYESYTLEVPLGVSEANFNDLSEDIYQRIAELMGDSAIWLRQDGVTMDIDVASKIIRGINSVGRYLYNELFFHVYRKQVRDFFIDAHLKWQINNGSTTPLIEMRTQIEHLFPIEFLPIFDDSLIPEIHNICQLVEVSKRFLGFSTIIRRVLRRYEGSVISESDLNNNPQLSVRFFGNAKLAAIEKERDFFANEKQKTWIEYRGYWPENINDAEEAINELAKILWDAAPPVLAGVHQNLDQIHHFACHCNTDKNKSSDYELIFTTRGYRKKRISVSIQNLKDRFSNYPARDIANSYPLVFLNACGSSKILPHQMASFVGLFLREGNRGVIGTEGNIPDTIAAEFAKLFYIYLVKLGNLGSAVFEARQDLLKHHCNLFGIFYAIYADPDISVKTRNPQLRIMM